ncbi:hypothetical protein TNCV_5021991 [Trichonephila clavipes]|nr:hypothetical protein TNCV_5021991 [Trichonephila clavipes]
MNQGILFRYSPTSESKEAQLVVPIHERREILKSTMFYRTPVIMEPMKRLKESSNDTIEQVCVLTSMINSPTTYEVANPNNPDEVLGPYHSSALHRCMGKEATQKRGRPRKDNSTDSLSRTIPRNQRVTKGKKDNRAPSSGRVDT